VAVRQPITINDRGRQGVLLPNQGIFTRLFGLSKVADDSHDGMLGVRVLRGSQNRVADVRKREITDGGVKTEIRRKGALGRWTGPSSS